MLYSTNLHHFTSIKEIRSDVAQTLDVNIAFFFTFRNFYSIDVKIAKNALRFMDTASVAHPCALSDIDATAPYKESLCVYMSYRDDV